MRIPLFESRSAIADVNGNATIRFSPGTAGASWTIQRFVTAVTGPTVTPRSILQLTVYRNIISEANRLDGTQSAAQDASEIPNGIQVPSADTILAVYSGIPAGASCQFTLSGYAETGRF